MKKNLEAPLSGVRVLDLADEQGSFCSKLLADLGATVVKIENPEAGVSRTSQSFRYNNLNKLGMRLDLKSSRGKKTFLDMIRNADVLVECFAPGFLETLRLGPGHLRKVNPSLIHLSITGFGRTGPKRAYRSCDSVQSAFGGQMHCTGIPAGKPVKLCGSQPHYAASLFGANAVLLGLRQRALKGHGRHIDLSIQEAVVSTLAHVMIDCFRHRMAPDAPVVDLRAESFSALPCKDGYIEMPMLRNADTILELAISEATPESAPGNEWRDAAFRNRHFGLFRDVVTQWTERHSRKELFLLGQALGLPWAPVQSLDEVRRSKQLKARRFFIQTTGAPGRQSLSVPGLPLRFSAFSPKPTKRAPLPGEHTTQVRRMFAAPPADRIRLSGNSGKGSPRENGRILSGIRVLDFTRMLSGPYATRILGDFGAEVIKVQSTLTASGAERNDSPYFGAWNRNKRSIGMNLNHSKARDLVLELVSISDVIVENFSPRVMANWGLTYRRLKDAKPDLIQVSISAMGQTGPWRNFVGFADTFHALSGLMHETSPSANPPPAVGFAYGDIIAGLYASLGILSCLEYRERTGRGQHLDLSSYEALCALLGPALIEASCGRESGGANPDNAEPWGCYPCAGEGSWCVIAISNEEEWHRFRRVSRMSLLMHTDFSEWSRKGISRSSLDDGIAQWTAALEAETVVRRLQKAGIAAAVVQSEEDLAGDSHLEARNFFTRLKHPKYGIHFADRSALWPWDEEHAWWKAAPELGEANRYVFVDLLGHSETELQEMVSRGILEQS